MSDRLHEVAQHIANHGLDADSWFTLRETAAESLKGTDSPRIIRTRKELEALELNDADAVVLASEAGAVRTVRALAAMHRLGSAWGLPAVVIATGDMVRDAREVMEQEHG